jgi:hypothetical protein
MIRDDEIIEWRLRRNYPLLCERFLDGYTLHQVASGHRLSSRDMQTEIDIEVYAAKRDPMCSDGLGKLLIKNADIAKKAKVGL